MGSSPQNGKRPMWFLLSKKKNKKKVKNYCPISLLPVSSKIFERLLYGSMFKFFTENSLISQNQSGFKSGDSCTNQLLSIMHQINKSFDGGHDVWSVFFKLKQNGISGNLLSTLTDFLKLRKQRVVLNGQPSSWSNIESGIP